MVRFNRDELYMMMNALESFWGSYEDKNNEEDVKINTEARRIYLKISREIDERDERKKRKQNSEWKYKFKNYEGDIEYYHTKEEMDEAIKNISSQLDC